MQDTKEMEKREEKEKEKEHNIAGLMDKENRENKS